MTSLRRLTVAAALLMAGAATPAFAQQDIGGGFSVTGNVGIYNDYRFRGISLTAEEPAVQGTVNINHSSGFYGGVWASNLDDTPLYGEVEVDLYAGYTHAIAEGTTIDVGLLYYLYPGNDSAAGDANYFEPYASISRTFGPVTAKVGAAYAWDQGEETAFGDNVFVYGELSAAIPTTPITITGHLGYSDGALSPTGHYLEWRLGADFALGHGFVANVSYVDSDLPEVATTDAAIVGSLRWGF